MNAERWLLPKMNNKRKRETMTETLTPKEAAKVLGIQPDTVRQYCRQYRFLCGQDDPQWNWWIDKASFLAWAKLPRKVGRPAVRKHEGK